MRMLHTREAPLYKKIDPKKQKSWGQAVYGCIPSKQSLKPAVASKVFGAVALGGLGIVCPGVAGVCFIQMGVGLLGGSWPMNS
jgi:hypothetical protein